MTSVNLRLLLFGHASSTTYAAPASNVDSAAAISALFQSNVIVQLVNGGVYYSNNSFSVPADRRLICNGATLKLRSTSTTTNVCRNFGVVEDAILDGSMSDRIAAGYARFCHGGLIRNARNAGFRRCTVNDVGDAIANGYASLSAVGIFIDRDETATADTLNCFAEGCRINDTAYILPFGMRIESNITGYAADEQGFYNRGSRFTSNIITGTIKNGIEVVGPDTKDFLVTLNELISPAGQGGMEVDFGGHDGTLSYNTVTGVGQNDIQVKSFSAFNARTSDNGDGKLKRTSNIVMQGNHMRGGRINTDFHIYAREDAGALNTQWINHKMSDMAVVTGAGRIVGHSMDTTTFPVTGMTDTSADIADATHAMILYGSNGGSDLTWTGGTWVASSRGFWNSSSATLSNVTLTGGINLTAPTLIDAKGPFTVNTATLSGTSITLSSTPGDLVMTNTTLTLPAAAMTTLTTAVPAIAAPGSNNTLIST